MSSQVPKPAYAECPGGEPPAPAAGANSTADTTAAARRRRRAPGPVAMRGSVPDPERRLLSAVGLPPCLPQLVPIEGKQDEGGKQQHGFVKRPRDREEPDRGQPAERARNPAVAHHDSHRTGCSLHEGGSRAHLPRLSEGGSA